MTLMQQLKQQIQDGLRQVRDIAGRVPGVRTVWRFVLAFSDAWTDDRLPRQSAAIAYFALFSMAPLLWLATEITSRLLGPQAVTGELHGQLTGFMGEQAATALEKLVGGVNARQDSSSTAALIGGATLIYGATGVFVELKDSLNLIWGLRRREGKASSFS